MNKYRRLLLEYYIRREGLNHKQVYEQMYISQSAWFNKINGIVQFTHLELNDIYRILNLTRVEYFDIFVDEVERRVFMNY